MNPNAASPLLRIPAGTYQKELRNDIYALVAAHGRNGKQLEFLATCKQIYKEAAQLAFAATEFCISMTWHEFYESHAGKTSRPRLRDLASTLHMRPTLLQAIDSVTIDMCYLQLDHMALLFQRGIHPARLIIERRNDDTVQSKYGMQLSPKFRIPSAALLQANPELQEVVFRWLGNPGQPSSICEVTEFAARLHLEEMSKMVKSSTDLESSEYQATEFIIVKSKVLDGNRRELKISTLVCHHL